MLMNKRTNLSIIITVAAFIFLFTGWLSYKTFLYHSANRQHSQAEVNITTAGNQNANRDNKNMNSGTLQKWSIFKSEQYKFEIKYPDNWSYADTGSAYPYIHMWSFGIQSDSVDSHFQQFDLGITNGGNKNPFKGAGPVDHPSYWDLGIDCHVGSNVFRKIVYHEQGQTDIWYILQGGTYDIVVHLSGSTSTVGKDTDSYIKNKIPQLSDILASIKWE
jgi:hypothetical protein